VVFDALGQPVPEGLVEAEGLGDLPSRIDRLGARDRRLVEQLVNSMLNEP
jgi:hypothetical protein